MKYVPLQQKTVKIMTIKKVLLLILLSFSSAFLLKADNAYADSLRNSLLETEGKERLEAIANLVFYFMPMDYDSALYYCDLGDEEAKKQGDIKTLCNFIYYHAVVFYNYYEYELLIAYVNKNLPIMAEEAATHTLYFQTKHFLATAYLRQRALDECLQTMRELYEEAKEQADDLNIARASITLADLYEDLSYSDEADFFVQEGIKHTEKCIENFSEKNSVDIATLMLDIVSLKYGMGRLEEAIELCDAFLKFLIDKEDFIKPYDEIGWYVYYQLGLSHKANIYLNLNDYENAKKYIDEAKEYITDDQIFTMLVMYYYACLDYCIAMKDYDCALYYIDLFMENSDQEGAAGVDDIIPRKAQIMFETGNYKESAELYQHITQVRDSIRSTEFKEQLSDLRIKYETAEKENKILEQEISLQRTRLILFIVALLLVAFAVVAILVWRYNRRITVKNRKLVAQINLLSKQEEELESLKETTGESDKSDEAILFSRLERLMQEKMLFLDLDINREDIAKMLNTNDFYLRSSIKAVAGISFGAYLNRLRINHARKLLASGNTFKNAVKDVAFSSGFNSLTTFNRLFKETYGLSAGEFRRISETFPRDSFE